jgi:hypothetical protein
VIVNVPAGASVGVDQPFAPNEVALEPSLCSCRSQHGRPATSLATGHTVLMAPVMTASSLNE